MPFKFDSIRWMISAQPLLQHRDARHTHHRHPLHEQHAQSTPRLLRHTLAFDTHALKPIARTTTVQLPNTTIPLLLRDNQILNQWEVFQIHIFREVGNLAVITPIQILPMQRHKHSIIVFYLTNLL